MFWSSILQRSRLSPLPAMDLENSKDALQQVNSGYERVEDEKQGDSSAQNSVTCTLLKGQTSLLSFFPAQVQEDKRTSMKAQGWDKLSKLSGRRTLDIKRRKTEREHESVPGLLLSLLLILGKV